MIRCAHREKPITIAWCHQSTRGPGRSHHPNPTLISSPPLLQLREVYWGLAWNSLVECHPVIERQINGFIIRLNYVLWWIQWASPPVHLKVTVGDNVSILLFRSCQLLETVNRVKWVYKICLKHCIDPMSDSLWSVLSYAAEVKLLYWVCHIL